MKQQIIALRMKRQHFWEKAREQEYLALYRDLQPGQNVYWNGFGQPPELSFRAAFDDRAYNGHRQKSRQLIKGRFAGGNLGWICREDLELFLCLYEKPLAAPTAMQQQILDLIRREGPLNIQQIKEETGLLVKEITPVLHRLQEAFLIYEDQYDGEWDRGWYRFEEMFPEVRRDRYTRTQALQQVLLRFAYRMVWFDRAMAKSFYRLPEKELKAALCALLECKKLVEWEGGYLLPEDAAALPHLETAVVPSVYALHRNDPLYKALESRLKEQFQPLMEGLEYDHEPLQYLLLDGAFHGAVVGHFRNGPYDLNDLVCDLPDPQCRREEMLAAVRQANFGHSPKRFMGKEIIE